MDVSPMNSIPVHRLPLIIQLISWFDRYWENGREVYSMKKNVRWMTFSSRLQRCHNKYTFSSLIIQLPLPLFINCVLFGWKKKEESLNLINGDISHSTFLMATCTCKNISHCGWECVVSHESSRLGDICGAIPYGIFFSPVFLIYLYGMKVKKNEEEPSRFKRRYWQYHLQSELQICHFGGQFSLCSPLK